MKHFSFLKSIWYSTWSEFAGLRALRCLPAVLAPLIYGLAFDRPVQGLLAAAAAVSVGFGSFQRLYNSRVAPMLLASLFMGLSVFAGTQLAYFPVGLVIAAAAWGFLCGISASIGPAATYVGTQSIVFLLLASSFPMKARSAVVLLAIVIGAGLLQTLIIWIFRKFTKAAVARERPGLRLQPLRGARLALHTVQHTARRHKSMYWHAVRLALIMAVSTGLSFLSHNHHRYWMPMSTAIILQQDLRQTITRALSRVGGTLVGIAIATLIAALLRPDSITLIGLSVAFAWLSYSTLKVNYFLFAASLTGYIVFLLSFAGLPEVPLVVTRAEFTVLGALVALGAYGIRKGTTTRPNGR